MAATVLFDGSCGMCVRFQRAGERLDWLGLLEWVPSQSPAAARFGIAEKDLDQAMHLVSGRKISKGFAAVKAILLRLPLFYLAVAGLALIEPWLLAAVLFFYTPLFAPIGEGIYAAVARRRSCNV